MYYHGSDAKFDIGNSIFPNPNGYTHSAEVKALEDLVEEEKPEHIKFSRRDCVFLCCCEDDIDAAGGYTDYIYTADIGTSPIESSDLSWYTKASIQLCEGDTKGARESARKYWSGECLDGLYEYRTGSFRVIGIT